MAYCYECGSEVGENDIFCPYCGISLKPVFSVDEEDTLERAVSISDESQSSPVMFEEQPNEPEMAEISIPSEPLPDVEIVDDKAVTLSDVSALKTEENIELKTEEINLEEANDEPKTPLILDEDKAKDNYEADSTDPSQVEILKPLEVKSENEIFSIQQEPLDENEPEQEVEKLDSGSSKLDSQSKSANLPDEDLVSQFDNPLPDEAEKTSNQFEIGNGTESEIVGTSAEKIPNDISASEVKEPEQDQDQVLTIAHPSQQLEKELEQINFDNLADPDEKSEESRQINESEVPNNFEENSIVKPAEVLQNDETNASPAVFDSVRIVQTESNDEDFEEKISEIEAKNLEQDELAQAANDETEEDRSYTTPNIASESTEGKKAAKLKPLEEGTILNGRYEIIRKIGGGGMGAVYLASDKNLGGVLRAVKEMVQSYIEEAHQEKAIADFKRESTLLTSLEHTAIPTIFDYFFDEKEARFYLVMKYISGGDLAGRLRASKEGKIDEKTVTEWAIQIADVLDYLHRHEPPIVYRDLKPANIMIDGNSGRLMLIDFGIARWINKEEKGVTAVGTMGYAPPELFSGNVDPRSDIYSLGSTMFHLLTGADPQSNPLLIFDFQKNPRPRQINSLISDQMERILMKSVEYNAEKRFESAAVLKKTLEEHLDNLKAGRISFGVTETASAAAVLPEEYVFCGFCGQKIFSSDVFCPFCGSKQAFAQQDGVNSPIIGNSVSAMLVLESIEEPEKPIFALEKESNLIGRRDPMSNIFPEIDLSKFDPQTKISRRHARIWREGNNFMVEDLGSSNGTILIPVLSEMVRLLANQPHILTNGDKIKIGDATLVFNLG